MSREPHDPASAERPLAAWVGPERVALALSIVAAIVLAWALGIGPFAAGPASPSVTSPPAPSPIGMAVATMSGLVVGIPGEVGPPSVAE